MQTLPTLAPTSRSQPSLRGASTPAAIDHVIVIYQENWSFDGLFGTFPGANGLANASPTSIAQTDRTGRPYATLPPSSDPRIPAALPVAPFDLAPYVPPDTRTGN